MMIIDDADASHSGRAKLIDTSITQVGFEFKVSTANTRTGVVMLDNGYVTDPLYGSCAEITREVVYADDGTGS